jgi:putative transposase
LRNAEGVTSYKSQKVRIYPTPSQAVQLEKQFGANRWLWNYMLNLQIERHARKEKFLNAFGMMYLLPNLKKELGKEWLKEVSANSLEKVALNLSNAYESFFAKAKGFPKFKSRHRSKPSATFSDKPKAIHDGDGTGRLQVPKIKGLKFRSGYAVPHSDKLKTVTITRDRLGNYFASLCYEMAKSEVPKLPYDESTTIGIDLGVKTFAVLSDGRTIEKPKNVSALDKRIEKQQAKLSRCQKGSNRRKKAIHCLNKLHISRVNRRTDWLHKTTRQLVDENQIHCIAVENLSVAGMLHDSHSPLARRIQDSCFGMFKTLLRQKLDAVGKTLGEIHRYEPSSKTCGACDFVHNGLTLSERSWACPSCGVEHDRDLNASNNIKRMWLRGSKKENKLTSSGGRLADILPFADGFAEDMTELGLPSREVSTLVG